MRKKEAVNYLKERWEAVHEIEIEELRKTSLKDRFILTAVIFDSGRGLKLYSERFDSEAYTIISRWQQLKDYYSEPK